MIKFSNFFFQAKKKEAKKSLVTTTATVCSNFFFQAKKKEAKKSPGHLRLCPGPRNAFFRKFFAYFFTKNKVSNLHFTSRRTNPDITKTLT